MEFPKGVDRIHLYNLDEELPEDEGEPIYWDEYEDDEWNDTETDKEQLI